MPHGSILDYLEPGDPAFLLLSLQESMPLSLFSRRAVYGGYEYDPRILFTLWMLALWSRTTSSRKLETLIRRDVRFIALAHGLRPDHSTLCRFRRELGDTIDELFVHVVGLAEGAGMVGFKRGHVDGHRLPGNVSQWRNLRVETEVNDFGDEVKAGSTAPEGLPDSLATGGNESLPAEGSDEAPCGKEVSEPNPVKPAKPLGDAEAKNIRTKKGYVRGYNAQAMADEKTGIVLSATVSDSSSDAALIMPVVAHCHELHGWLPESVVADKGYDTPRNANALELLGIESYIPAHLPSIFTLTEDGRLVCPAGLSPNRQERFKAKGVPVLRQVVDKCKGCEHWPKCSRPDKKPKGAKRNPENPSYLMSIRSPEGVPVQPQLRMHARCRTDEGKQALKKRCSTIERVFAHSKTHMGFTRFSLRGLDLVELEWRLQMMAYNLWRLRKALCHAFFGLLQLFTALLAAVQRLQSQKPDGLTLQLMATGLAMQTAA